MPRPNAQKHNAPTMVEDALMSSSSSIFPWYRAFTVTLVVSLLGFTACSTPDETSQRNHDLEGNNPTIQVSLYSSGSFFDGAVMAEATVARGLTGPMAKTISQRRKKITMDPRLTNRAIGEALPTDGRKLGQIGELGSNEAPVTLIVSFQNTGSETITLAIRDVTSPLGNFVPQPRQLILNPGQTLDLEPMISRLGVISAEIPLTLALKLGDKKEFQVIVLRPAEDK